MAERWAMTSASRDHLSAINLPANLVLESSLLSIRAVLMSFYSPNPQLHLNLEIPLPFP